MAKINFVGIFVALMSLLTASAALATEMRGSKPYREAVYRYYEKPVPVKGKILGGEYAKWKDHKWQVALLVSWISDPARAQFCGGSIIGESWVVTAAHCVSDDMHPADLNVLSGTDTLGNGGERLNVLEIFTHQNYDDLPYNNDIALLHVDGKLKGEAIALASAADEANLGRSVSSLTISGWGITETGQTSKRLKRVSVPYVSRRKCNSPPSYHGNITDTMICAGHDEGRQDSCQGDSGGPAVADRKLYGIVSWGEGCAEPFKYGVYTNVAKLSGWVVSCMSDTAACVGSTAAGSKMGKTSIAALKRQADQMFSQELAEQVRHQIDEEVAQFIRSGAEVGRSWMTAYLADDFYSKLGVGAFANTPTMKWNGFDNDRPSFVFVPNEINAFSFRTASGRTIMPGLMNTDGGSVPLILHSLPKFSAWWYGPGYIVHDWMFVAHKCGTMPDNNISFEESATILAEALKTLMEVGFVDYDGVRRMAPKSEDTLYLIYLAVRSKIAKGLWQDAASVTCR
ncbi:serine protease [Endothiovibrio diazotrophicus]